MLLVGVLMLELFKVEEFELVCFKGVVTTVNFVEIESVLCKVNASFLGREEIMPSDWLLAD